MMFRVAIKVNGVWFGLGSPAYKDRRDAETYLTVNADRYMLAPSVIIEAEYQGHDDQKDPIHQDQSGVAGSAAGSLSDLLWGLREPGILSGLREDG
jgi:hypothetical protein